MNFGMLWFDNDPQTNLSDKVTRAAAYYREKYGQTPNVCLVNPEMIKEEESKPGEVEVNTSPAILPHHLWIGFSAAGKKQDKI